MVMGVQIGVMFDVIIEGSDLFISVGLYAVAVNYIYMTSLSGCTQLEEVERMWRVRHLES